jgi:hypothetical protein
MKKPITPYAHGVLDYTTSAMVAAAPRVMRLPRSAAVACYALAGGMAGLALLTDYPLSAKRAIPFKAHGASDASLAALLPALPWLLGFARHRRARNFFLGLTALTVGVAALTDWNKRSERVARRRHKRRPRIAA